MSTVTVALPPVWTLSHQADIVDRLREVLSGISVNSAWDNKTVPERQFEEIES